MPKDLPKRCQPDSIEEFRAAARQRFQDGHTLLAEGRRTAAIYLWGYSAEMVLKAAYFEVIGFAYAQKISLLDIKTAVTTAKSMGITWAGNLHYLMGWIELLVATRSSKPGLAYSDPGFGNEVKLRGRILQRLWIETLRYHKNMAYQFEAESVRDAAAWLLENDSLL